MSEIVELNRAEWHVLTEWQRSAGVMPVEFAHHVHLPGHDTVEALVRLAHKGVLNRRSEPVAGKQVMWRP